MIRDLLLFAYTVLPTPGFARDGAAADNVHKATPAVQPHRRCEPTYGDLTSLFPLAAEG